MDLTKIPIEELKALARDAAQALRDRAPTAEELSVALQQRAAECEQLREAALHHADEIGDMKAAHAAALKKVTKNFAEEKAPLVDRIAYLENRFAQINAKPE